MEIWWRSLATEKTSSLFHFHHFHLVNDGEVFLSATGIETEGLLWFSNLSVSDPYYILPCILLLSNLTNIEVSIAMYMYVPERTESSVSLDDTGNESINGTKIFSFSLPPPNT